MRLPRFLKELVVWTEHFLAAKEVVGWFVPLSSVTAFIMAPLTFWLFDREVTWFGMLLFAVIGGTVTFFVATRFAPKAKTVRVYTDGVHEKANATDTVDAEVIYPTLQMLKSAALDGLLGEAKSYPGEEWTRYAREGVALLAGIIEWPLENILALKKRAVIRSCLSASCASIPNRLRRRALKRY